MADLARESESERMVLKELRTIPGVGTEISRDLWNIGIRSIAELAGGDPDELYRRICRYQGTRVDRCMLYVMRCAVYFASTEEPDPERLKWWAWKDTDYVPVDCTFHDRLEAAATLRRENRIVFRDSGGESRQVRDRITDVFARGAEEFVKLASGVEVRLDSLEAIDGHENPTARKAREDARPPSP